VSDVPPGLAEAQPKTDAQVCQAAPVVTIHIDACGSGSLQTRAAHLPDSTTRGIWAPVPIPE